MLKSFGISKFISCCRSHKLYSNVRSLCVHSRIVSLLSKMPKEPLSAIQMKEQRLKTLKKIASKPLPAPSELYFWILGNGGSGNPKSLLLTTDQSRYLFNCGEGVQRLAHEHKLKLAKVQNIFLTSTSWQHIGGLPGLVLTLQDVGVPFITMHGPDEICQLFDMTKFFVQTEITTVQSRSLSAKTFVDNCLEVTYVPLEVNQEKANYIRCPVVSYVCKAFPKPGALNLEKCVELGVPPGPLLGKLKGGTEITLSDGRVIKPLDVVSPEEPGPVFIVVDIPSEEYVDCLLENESFKLHQTGGNDKPAWSVFHVGPSNVLQHEGYQEWCKRFPDSTTHIMLNEQNNMTANVAPYRAQARLNLIHNDIFPLLWLPNEVPAKTANGIYSVKTLQRVKYRPKFENLVDAGAVNIDLDAYRHEALSISGFTESIETLNSVLKENSSTLTAAEFPEVVFLGTGSAVPGKERNVSAILINSTNSSFLMDCGEGTLGQLTRFYGPAELERILRRLKGVYISHMHADHHLGLIQVMQKRWSIDNSLAPFLIVGPRFLIGWLTKYSEVFERISHLYEFVNNADLMESCPRQVLERFGVDGLKTTRVIHCRDAFGVRVSIEGFDIVYSGDTRPCDALVTLGHRCDLLIHEATMEDELADEAVIKAHSTTSQAIDIGRKMEAKFTLLTHFSQRYAKLPLVEKFPPNVGCAFDNMRVRPKDFSVLPELLAPIRCLFAEYVDEMMQKTERKLLKRELQLKKELSTSSA